MKSLLVSAFVAFALAGLPMQARAATSGCAVETSGCMLPGKSVNASASAPFQLAQAETRRAARQPMRAGGRGIRQAERMEKQLQRPVTKQKMQQDVRTLGSPFREQVRFKGQGFRELQHGS